MSHEPEINQPRGEIEARIEKLVYGGRGLARIDGRVALVPFVAPGELVRIKILSEKPGMLEARLRQVIETAPERVEPPCPFFYRCGGCQYQHIDYKAQVEQKRSILAEVFRRVGKFEPPPEIRAIAGEPWGYRNRVQLHFAGGEIGYFSHGSRKLTPYALMSPCSSNSMEPMAQLKVPLCMTRATFSPSVVPAFCMAVIRMLAAS